MWKGLNELNFEFKEYKKTKKDAKKCLQLSNNTNVIV